MLREDLSGRFDYLFEPLDVAKTAGDGRDEGPQAAAVDEDEGRWSRRIVLAGVVLATLAAAAATAVALLQPAQPALQVVTPTDATPSSTPISTSPPMPSPIPSTTAPSVAVLPATVSPSVVRAPIATPTVQQPQTPAQQPTTVASEPPATMPPPPTTRAPISVSPETRTPFPNQTPRRGNDDSGGLLGGLL
jgi:hypothetical protein